MKCFAPFLAWFRLKATPRGLSGVRKFHCCSLRAERSEHQASGLLAVAPNVVCQQCFSDCYICWVVLLSTGCATLLVILLISWCRLHCPETICCTNTIPLWSRHSIKFCKSVYPWERVSEIQSIKVTICCLVCWVFWDALVPAFAICPQSAIASVVAYAFYTECWYQHQCLHHISASSWLARLVLCLSRRGFQEQN